MHLICNSLKKLLKQPKALTCYILNLNISLIYIYMTYAAQEFIKYKHLKIFRN